MLESLLQAIVIHNIHTIKTGNGMHLHISFFDLADPQKNIFGTQVSFPSSKFHSHNAFSIYCNFHFFFLFSSCFFFFFFQNSLTKMGGHFVEGVLRHLSALCAITLPSDNSFDRVGKVSI